LIAIIRASETSGVVTSAFVDQPTARREKVVREEPGSGESGLIS
jgi:hypothetical protein